MLSNDYVKDTLLDIFYIYLSLCQRKTRPALAGFKTAEEGRAIICKFLWQKLKNKINIEKHIMNNFRTL